MKLRIATFNIRNSRGTELQHLWWRRRRAVLDVVHGLEADVLGVQEAYRCQYRWLARRLGPGWDHHGVGRTDGRRRGEHCPVFCRAERAVLTGRETRWFGDQPHTPGTRLPGATFPRIATKVTIRLVGEDRIVHVVNTHLDEHHAENRVAAMSQIREWVAPLDDPTIVLGDLNDGLESDELSVLLDAGFRSALPAGSGGTNHDYTGSAEGTQIDHVLVDESWLVSDAWIDTTRPGGRLASDHWPVVADLELEA